MAPRQGSLRSDGRPRAKTPAERAEEAADVQRRLKREAAERRDAAAAREQAKPRSDVGARGGRTHAAARRRTP
jgi:hypothetical protein